MSEKLSWPKPRDRGKGPWIFKITDDFVYQSDLTGRPFDSEWLQIHADGRIVIKGSNGNGYAWDGCTPKYDILSLLIIGAPDGTIDIKTGKPKTFHASLVHDALYQYLIDVPVSKKEVDELFHKILEEKGFKLRKLYYWAVRLFGGRGIKQKSINIEQLRK